MFINYHIKPYKSKEEGDWFYHEDEWCGAGGISID